MGANSLTTEKLIRTSVGAPVARIERQSPLTGTDHLTTHGGHPRDAEQVPLGGGAGTPGLTVILKLVLVLKPPPSVAVSVTLVTPLIEGVPLMNLPDRVRPAGKALDDRA